MTHVRISDMSSEKKLILASGSPRRKELLSLLGLPFDVKKSYCDEGILQGEKPLDYVQRVAAEKGKSCADNKGAWVLSADTIVEQDGKVIGKPKDHAEGKAILHALRGREHQVFTAITLSQNGTVYKTCCRTAVSMRDYSEDEIDRYILTESPMDKAGAYAIQDAEFHPVHRLKGCWANVMGLPVCHLYRLLQKAALQPEPGIATRCQHHLGINCPVFAEILNEA